MDHLGYRLVLQLISLAATTPAGLGAYILSIFDTPTAATEATTGNRNWSVNGTVLMGFTGSSTRLKSNAWLLGGTVMLGIAVGVIAFLM